MVTFQRDESQSLRKMILDYKTNKSWGFPGSSVVKNSPANAGDAEYKMGVLVAREPENSGFQASSSCDVGKTLKD